MLPLKQELEQRGLLKQYTNEKLFDLYEQGGQKFYYGCDPSADSLHVGNFVGFMLALHLMRRGNTFIPLVGGATGMIGDPGGKDGERSFLSPEQVNHNVQALQQQMQTICTNMELISGEKLSITPVVNNADFYVGMGYIDFLREVGKYITVNNMIKKETIARRIEDPDKFISYTEFSYMLIQGYDFVHLYKHHDCKLQICGSDQRGNGVTGVELINKVLGKDDANVVTAPLLLDSTGKKFGKSEGNAIWLDPRKNSPYYVYQYFLNVADADVERLLKVFTLYDLDIISQIVATHNQNPAERHGQAMLAEYVVKLIFGQDAARQAQVVTDFLFGDGSVVEKIKNMSSNDIEAVERETNAPIPSFPLTGGRGPQDPLLKGEGGEAGWGIVELLVSSGLASSNGEAKKLIQGGGIYLNEQKVEDIAHTVSSSDAVNGVILLRKGKKGYRVVRI